MFKAIFTGSVFLSCVGSGFVYSYHKNNKRRESIELNISSLNFQKKEKEGETNKKMKDEEKIKIQKLEKTLIEEKNKYLEATKNMNKENIKFMVSTNNLSEICGPIKSFWSFHSVTDDAQKINELKKICKK